VQALPGGRLVMENFSLRGLIQFAYGVRDFQMEGLPAWTDLVHYDVQAKAEGDFSVKQMEGPMLQALLEDRFQLRVHREIRQMPVYELSVAKSGVKMKATGPGECVPYDANAAPPVVHLSGAGGLPVFCGYPTNRVTGSNRTLDGAGVSAAVLIANLSRLAVDRSIIDKTGLDAGYDVHLEWAADALADDAGGTSIFTALQEQLGLKLEAAKGPVEVLVIDSVKRASPN
jgi:uncharacterized protein (TIGR03435 family)